MTHYRTISARLDFLDSEIARSVNAGIARPDDAKRGLHMLEQVYELIDRTKKKVVSNSSKRI